MPGPRSPSVDDSTTAGARAPPTPPARAAGDRGARSRRTRTRRSRPRTRRHVAELERLLVLGAVARRGPRGRTRGVDERRRRSGGRSPSPIAAPHRPAVKCHMPRPSVSRFVTSTTGPFTLRIASRRASHQEDRHQARVEAARADDGRVEARRSPRPPPAWIATSRLEPQPRDRVAAALPGVDFHLAARRRCRRRTRRRCSPARC